MAESVDVLVIGMGPGGETAAGELAEAGLSVGGIEGRLVGGECPYYGGIPSEMMIRAGNSLADGRRIRHLAGDADVRPDWNLVAGRIRSEATDNWDDTVAVERFTGKGGQFVRGRGTITGARTVSAAGREFIPRRAIMTNTGTEPMIPPVPGLAGVPYWTNREATAATEIPESLIVIGGGAIGAELAQSFARLGIRVTVVEAAPRLRPPEEPEAGKLLAEVLSREGIGVHVGARIENVHYSGGSFTLGLGGSTLTASQGLVATGRTTNPEIASVGLSGTQAREEGFNVRVGFTDLVVSARGWLHKSGNQGFIKLVEDTDRGVLDGATSAGPAGGEVLSALTLAVHARNPVSTLHRMIYAYPTFHRAIEDALAHLD